MLCSLILREQSLELNKVVHCSKLEVHMETRLQMAVPILNVLDSTAGEYNY